ncbi:MAG: TonB-dependent receptor plug domain-containing protein, partial [Burkholderiaceae bacterium]
MMIRHRPRCGFDVLDLAAIAAACAATPGQAQPALSELPPVVVIGTTPLPGLGTPLRDVPANVQTYGARDLARQRQGNVTEFLEQNPTSVNVNAAQGNPYQLDVSFRGFTASPLVGVPQGLSVFQDGVRTNEPFGDVVNWDLLPQSAISSITLIPGSNPLFGLNTLGGALAIATRSGRDSPGGAVELSGGSFGRKTLQFEQGGVVDAWDYFLTGNLSKDHGWAQHNPSRVEQLFGKLGYKHGDSEADLSLTAANNRLEGTQTLPVSFFDDIRQAYTYPDINTNKLTMLALKGRHFLSTDTLISANLYLRNLRNVNLSSNVNADFGVVDPLTGLPDTVEALNDRAAIDQTSSGLGLQLTFNREFGTWKNQLVLGSSGDFGRASYTQEAQPADLTPARGAVATGDFALATHARTGNRNLALYLLDSLALTPQWTLTASGRYDAARV